MSVGENIVNLRKEKNISQEELANLIGVSRPTLSKIEKNAAKLDIDCANEICKVFSITLDELYSGKKNHLNDKEAKLKNQEVKPKKSKFDIIFKRVVIIITAMIILTGIFLYTVYFIIANTSSGETYLEISYNRVIMGLIVIYSTLFIVWFIHYLKVNKKK